MKHFTRFLLMISVLLLVGTGAFSQTSNRNLTEYKQGPSFDLRNYYLPLGNQEKAPLRQFLWDLWSTRTKGSFSVIFYTREGAPTNCKFYVEPNSMGQWVIVSECNRTVCPYSSEKRCRNYLKTIHTNTYDVVKRVGYSNVISSPSATRIPKVQIPDFERRNSLDFVLTLESSTSRNRSEW